MVSYSYVNKGLTSKQRREKEAELRIKSYTADLEKTSSESRKKRLSAKIEQEKNILNNSNDLSSPETKSTEGGVTFITPAKDSQGKTATDRLVESNKQTLSSQGNKYSNTYSITSGDYTYSGGIENVGGKDYLVGFSTPEMNTARAEAKANQQYIDDYRYAFANAGAQKNKEETIKNIATNIKLKQALPITTYKLPVDTKLTISKPTPEPVPEKSSLAKGWDKLNNPLAIPDFILEMGATAGLSKRNIEKQTIATYTLGQTLEDKGLTGLGKGFKSVAGFQYDFSTTLSEEIRKPSTWAIAGATSLAFKGIGSVSKLGAKYLAPKTAYFSRVVNKRVFLDIGAKVVNTGFISSFVGYEGYNVITGKKTLGQSLGGATAFLTAYQVSSASIKAITPKVKELAYKIDFNSKYSVFSSKSGSYGGRGKMESIKGKKLSKTQLRKQSYKAVRDNNIFYDRQTGELGVKWTLPDKQFKQFTKQRTIRLRKKSPAEIEGDILGGKIANQVQPYKVSQIKDTLPGGRGSVTTNYITGVSYTGKAPPIRVSKLYPKGYGSQSLSVVKTGKGDLMGVTLIQKKGAPMYHIEPPRTNKVPEVKPVQAPYTITGGSQVGVVQTNPFLKKVKYNTIPAPEPTIIRGGFRKGFGDTLLSRVQNQAQTRQANFFVSSFSTATNILPAPTFINKPVYINPNVQVSTIFTESPSISVTQVTPLISLTSSNVLLNELTARASFKPISISDIAKPKSEEALAIAQQQTYIQAQDIAQDTAQAQALDIVQIYDNAFTSGGRGRGRTREIPGIPQPPNPLPPNNPFIDNPFKPKPPEPIKPRIPKPRVIEPGLPEIPTLPGFRLPKIKSPVFKGFKPSKVKQPKAFSPTLKSIFLNEKGKTSQISITSGLGNRLIPITTKKKKKKKTGKGGFLLW